MTKTSTGEHSQKPAWSFPGAPEVQEEAGVQADPWAWRPSACAVPSPCPSPALPGTLPACCLQTGASSLSADSSLHTPTEALLGWMSPSRLLLPPTVGLEVQCEHSPHGQHMTSASLAIYRTATTHKEHMSARGEPGNWSGWECMTLLSHEEGRPETHYVMNEHR